VYVTTNNGALWMPVMEYGEASGGWIQEELDLTPYLGKVVRVGWGYALFSFGAVAHPGWLVDDVSITVASVERGTILVTNNLAQASFHLSGPLTAGGFGWLATFPNAPPGQYVVQYDPVSYYLTPSSQTNVLTGTDTVTFKGEYSFADINSNGISDAWEVAFFGVVSPNHPPDLDTDDDGQSDYAEFVAGTNPADAASALTIAMPELRPNRTVYLEWPSARGHAYRLELSTNLDNWLPASAWIVATNTNSSVTLPPLRESPAFHFRVEVRP
jgi:hypothetical protein